MSRKIFSKKEFPTAEVVEINRKSMVKQISKFIIEFDTFERLYDYNDELRDFCDEIFGKIIYASLENTNSTSHKDITIDIDDDSFSDEEDEEDEIYKIDDSYKIEVNPQDQEENYVYKLEKMYSYFYNYNVNQIKKMNSIDLFWLYHTLNRKFKNINLVDENTAVEFGAERIYFNFNNKLCFVNLR